MTLTQQEWDEVERLTNGEYMTQVEDAGFGAALAGVKLALAVVNQYISPEEMVQLALTYLSTYGNKEGLPLRPEAQHALNVFNYGSEEEAIAQERFDAILDKLNPPNTDHVRIWHRDTQGTWHMLESSKEGSRWKYYYEQGADPVVMRVEGSPDYLYSWNITGLFSDVKSEKQFDVYAIPVEQWTFSPDIEKEG